MTLKLILIILAGLLSGCASFISTVTDAHHPNRKTIAVPPGSTVVMLDEGTIVDSDKDGWVEIHRGAGAFRSNAGRVEDPDGKVLGVVRSGVTPWVFGNFIPYNGVIIGFIIDFGGGGAFNPKFVATSTTK